MSHAHYITREDLERVLEEELDERLAALATRADLDQLRLAVEGVEEKVDAVPSELVDLLRGRERAEVRAAEKRWDTLHLLVDRLTMPFADWRVMLGVVALAGIVATGFYQLNVATKHFTVSTAVEAEVKPLQDVGGDDGAMLPDSGIGGDEGPALDP